MPTEERPADGPDRENPHPSGDSAEAHVFRPAADVAFVDREDYAVVLVLGRPAEPMVLSGSAFSVWRAIGEAATEDDVIATVAEAYDLDPAVIGDDCRGFIAELVELELLTSSPAQTV